jgi:hypothetical protein
MTQKLNWWRVEKEQLARERGSERIGDLHPAPNLPKFDGCTCGKPMGFTGEHRKSCPLKRGAKAMGQKAAARNSGSKLPPDRPGRIYKLGGYEARVTKQGKVLYRNNLRVPRAETEEVLHKPLQPLVKIAKHR